MFCKEILELSYKYFRELVAQEHVTAIIMFFERPRPDKGGL